MPDLAADPPEVSEDGLTYTFTLKDGIMFGPPLSRAITSEDVKYAFDRLANPDIGAFGYPLYYEVITGFKAVADGKAKSVSGIETPDDKTIVFHLTSRPATSSTGSRWPRRGRCPRRSRGASRRRATTVAT